ncbi:MAG: AAA family ATPase [Pseudomonadota bacterium]
MKRNILNKLINWKNSQNRKPILLKGARQVGKTYIIKEFGKTNFENVHYFDFMKNKKLCDSFLDTLNPDQILLNLELQNKIKIDINKDLIVFDEIQECEKAISSLKYFYETYPGAFIIGSGSFLGLSLGTSSFPVGKVEKLNLYPMSFFEFLEGIDNEKILNLMTDGYVNNKISKVLHDEVLIYLKYYIITGGLPEVVSTFHENSNDLQLAFAKVRELQKSLLFDYEADISKHSGKSNAVKILSVFNNVPLQLARENKQNKKFIFKNILPKNSNYSNLEDPISWLTKAGLIHKISICKRAVEPLKAYTEENRFNLFMFDIGILGAMLDLDPISIFKSTYKEYKGYIFENFVIQELVSSQKFDFYSWKEGTSEIEILARTESGITPIEVKSGLNTKAKSLKVFVEKYAPQKRYLLSPLNIKKCDSGMVFLPIYCASLIQ